MPLSRGLSPPTRGSPIRPPPGHKTLRSIPAHAGEPTPVADPTAPRQVYPRPRGGAATVCRLYTFAKGLSPPTRGSPCRVAVSFSAGGSIPAHAGEPNMIVAKGIAATVYPRPRGGALGRAEAAGGPFGLSPPTRGSRRAPAGRQRLPRSIPAHAGEPMWTPGGSTMSWVYPRPRGGAGGGVFTWLALHGLSPPTRGSHAAHAAFHSRRRSIPAHAGEPRRYQTAICLDWVYPRPRGGAIFRSAPLATGEGLSPPTRGSRRRPDPARQPQGSIPAHAGEPGSGSGSPGSRKVYPRPRGGARKTGAGEFRDYGLSPPTRGSRHPRTHRFILPRSIPAHAGEPGRRLQWKSLSAVYPRPRGGASAAFAPGVSQ